MLCELIRLHIPTRIIVRSFNPLHTFPRNFPVDGAAANLLRTCYWETGVMDFGLYTRSLPRSRHRRQ